MRFRALNTIKKHWKILLACTALVLVAVLVLGLVSVRLTATTCPKISAGRRSKVSELTLTTNELAPEGMLAAFEDDQNILFINKDTAAISLYDKKLEVYWNSNPTVAQIENSGAMGNIKSEMSSQLILTYYDENGLQQYFNTYAHSASQGKADIKAIENGISVTYTIGEDEILISMLPVAIEKARFEKKILSHLNDEQKEDVTDFYSLQKIADMTESKQKIYRENFPKAGKNTEYYFLDLSAPDYALPKIYEAIFSGTEYTAEDMSEDNNKVGYSGESETLLQIVITVEYTLEHGNLVVRIPTDDISVSDGIYLTDIEVLPFFGNADTNDEGYMFVPDGSGGIVNFNNGRTQTPALEIPIYGKDGALTVNENNVSAASAQLPVFAMAKNNNAFLAHIGAGEENATVISRVSGMETNINQVYARFCVLPKDVMVIKTSKDSMSTNLYQENYYSGDILLRYSFYSGEATDYSSLASSYRSYLIEQGLLKEKETESQFYVSLTGRIKSQKNFFGINYNSYDTVTSFEDAEIIANELKNNGVDKINMAFSSWFGGGLATSVPANASPAFGMGSKKELNSLAQVLGSETQVALGASVQKIWKGIPTFNAFKYADRYLTNKSVKGYSYNIATNLADEKADQYYILNSKYLGSMSNKYISSVADLGDYSIWLDDAANILSSDFRSKNQTDRTSAKQLTIAALSEIPQETELILSAPNLYAVSYADTALAIPLTSSDNHLINKSVPFLQIVLSGCVDYTTPSINGLGDAKENILRAVETGSTLYFDWIYASDENIAKMKGKEPARLFSKNYKNWIDLASDAYKRIDTELSEVQKGAIIAHKQIENGVFRTDWENGYVLVNYTDTNVTIEGVTVPAQDFKVCK